MSLLKDKFNIIENHVKDVAVTKLNSIVENYFENLLNSGEKVIHPDFIKQVFWFEKNLDYIKILNKQLDNFLKMKKTTIRNNIKKGIFEKAHLIKIIKDYGMQINKLSFLSPERRVIQQMSSLHLFNIIISDPSIITFLKNELNNINENTKSQTKELFSLLYVISDLNVDLKIIPWFIQLIASSLEDTINDIISKNYPVPQSYQIIIQLVNLFKFFKEVIGYYDFLKNDIEIVISKCITNLSGMISLMFQICNINQIIKFTENHFSIMLKILNIQKNLKDLITKPFVGFMNNIISTNSDITIDFLKKISTCYQLFENLLPPCNDKYIIKIKISQFFSDEKILDMLIDILNQNILNNDELAHKKTNDVANMFSFCNNIKEKDVFIDKYNRKLIQRILYKQNISSEQLYYNILVDKFGDKLTMKTKKIIYDMDQTINDSNNFKKLVEAKTKVNIVTTSYGNWDVNQNEGLIGDNLLELANKNLLTQHMNLYSSFYKKRYDNRRKLNWYLHFGEIVFDYKAKEFKMMPIQYLILEEITNKLLNKTDILKLDIIKNYNDNFKQALISCLIFGGILKIKKDLIILNDDINNISVYDYINLFFTTTNFGNIWEAKRQDELIMTREDILSSNINHSVKVNKMPIDKLFEEIKSNLNVFTLERDFYDKVIKIMVEKDYIKISDCIVEKLFY